MKILIYAECFPGVGGIETSIGLLGEYLQQQGDQMVVVAHRYGMDTAFTKRIGEAVACHYVPGGLKQDPEVGRQFLRSVIHEEKADLVLFLDSYARVELNLIGQPELGVPLIVSERSCPFNPHRSVSPPSLLQIYRDFRLRRYNKKVGRPDNRRLALYEACSRYVLHSTRYFGEFRCLTSLQDIRKLRAIPNGLGLRPILADENKQKRWPKTVLYLGSLNEHKGVHYLLQAWNRLVPDFPEWSLTVVGDGPLRHEHERFTREQNLANVTFDGYQDDPLRYYESASILAFPSVREGWGLSLVEAMSQGLVPVAFNSYSAVYDIIDDGVNGRLVPAFDVDAYEKGLRGLMTSPEKLRTMAVNAAKKTEAFSMDRVGGMWRNLFQEVLSL